MVFPPVHWFQGLGAGVVIRDVGDIEFLSKKEFDGKLVENEGTRTTTGDLATLTASSGKDMYLAKAKVSATTVAESFDEDIIIELKVNGVIKETWATNLNRTSGGVGKSAADEYEFATSGIKVAATQIIKLEVVTITATSVQANGVIVCFEETTGETPVI